MPPAPLTAALLTGLTTALGLIHLAVYPEPFVPQRALIVSLAMALFGLVVVAGVLVARGRWARWALLTVGGMWMALPARTTFDALGLSTLAAGATLVALAAGPWLPRWLRHRPAADGPPPAAAVLLLILIATPLAVGVADPDPTVITWIGAGWPLVLAFGVARASGLALWAGRIAYLPLLAVVAVVSGLPGGLAVAALAAAATTLLWRRDVHLAVSPLLPDPSPAVPIPPELVDPEILRAAGLDDRGRRLERS